MPTQSPDTESAAAPGGALCLLLIGEQQFATHSLPAAGELVVGRSPSADVCLEDASLAPAHVLLKVGEMLSVTDLSGAGTRVRGSVLERGQTVAVTAGESISIGAVMMMVQRRAEAAPRRIWPHGYFEARVEEECIRAERYKTQFAVMRVHCEPTEPASVLEAGLSKVLRLVDIVALHSPGVYEVLLSETPPSGSQLVAERLAETLGARIGMASYPQDGRGADELLSKAGTLALREDTREDMPTIVPSNAMRHVNQLVERIAVSTINVLILGETGVGKEKLAEQVHKLSRRSQHPFVALNGAALSESLLESELFGHERGAFTGATGTKPGLLEVAEGGTVFLDEVGELPLSVQVKLLRVLETRQVFRVGSVKARPIDVRFVAATNRDLERESDNGTFRQDLFFRLNGISLVIPPLRERTSEIPALANAFITEACRKYARPVEPLLSSEALALMMRYRWPGNIRELRNIIERAVVICVDGAIRLEHLPVEKMNATFAEHTSQRMPATRPGGAPNLAPVPVPAAPAAQVPAGARGRDELLRELQDVERQRIVDALAACAGNQTVAAEKLGISRRTLVNRMRDFNISGPRKAR